MPKEIKAAANDKKIKATAPLLNLRLEKYFLPILVMRNIILKIIALDYSDFPAGVPCPFELFEEIEISGIISDSGLERSIGCFKIDDNQKLQTAMAAPLRNKSILLSVVEKSKKAINITQSPKIPLSQFCHIF